MKDRYRTMSSLGHALYDATQRFDFEISSQPKFPRIIKSSFSFSAYSNIFSTGMPFKTTDLKVIP